MVVRRLSPLAGQPVLKEDALGLAAKIDLL
jgi:hypothetical protein